MKFQISDLVHFALVIIFFIAIGYTAIYLEDGNPLGILTGILAVFLMNGGGDKILNILKN